MGSRLRELNKMCKINSDILTKFFKRLSETEFNKRTNIFIRSFEFIIEVTGMEDPHREEKYEIYERFLSLCKEIMSSIDRIDVALRYSINANLLDVEMHDYKPDIENILKLLNRSIVNLGGDPIEIIDRYRQIYYILDNSGEHLFDLLLIKNLQKMGKDVTILIRELPYEIDVTRELVVRGMQDVGLIDVDIVEVYGRCPPILYAIKEFDQENSLIISKGIANLEAYIDWCIDKNNNVLFLLVAKCSPIARLLGVEKGSGVTATSDYIKSRVKEIFCD